MLRDLPAVSISAATQSIGIKEGSGWPRRALSAAPSRAIHMGRSLQDRAGYSFSVNCNACRDEAHEISL